MLNENLICFILTLVIVVLFLYLYKIEKFETATDKLTDDEIIKAKTKIIQELEAQLKSMSPTNSVGIYIAPKPTELTSFYDDLTEKLLKNLGESKLTELIEFEKKCLENQQLLSEIKNNSQ